MAAIFFGATEIPSGSRAWFGSGQVQNVYFGNTHVWPPIVATPSTPAPYPISPAVITVGPSTPVDIYGAALSGHHDDALLIGGWSGSNPIGTGASWEYDGTSFSSWCTLSTPHHVAGGAASGTRDRGIYISATRCGACFVPGVPNFTCTNNYTYAVLSSLFNGSTPYGDQFGTPTEWNSIGGDICNAVASDGNAVYAWNGSAWSSHPAAPSITAGASIAGNCDAAILNSGDGTSHLYNGTSWSATSNPPMSTCQAAFTGRCDRAVLGGGTPAVNTTGIFDGSNWAAGTNFPSVRCDVTSTGGMSHQLFLGGRDSGGDYITSAQTLEWTTDFPTPLSTGSAQGCFWSHLPNSPSSRNCFAMAGTSADAVVAAGGLNSSTVLTSDSYNGTSWATEGNAARSKKGATSGIGMQCNALFYGGGTQSPAPQHSSFELLQDGVFKVGGAGVSQGKYAGAAGIGSADSALVVGALANSFAQTSHVEEYDGYISVNCTSTPVCMAQSRGGGTTNAGIAVGSRFDDRNYNIQFDGTSWSTCTVTPFQFHNGGAGGTQNGFWVAGGCRNTTAMSIWNGTSWTRQWDLPGAARESAGSGWYSNGVVQNGAAAYEFSDIPLQAGCSRSGDINHAGLTAPPAPFNACGLSCFPGAVLTSPQATSFSVSGTGGSVSTCFELYATPFSEKTWTVNDYKFLDNDGEDISTTLGASASFTGITNRPGFDCEAVYFNFDVFNLSGSFTNSPWSLELTGSAV